MIKNFVNDHEFEELRRLIKEIKNEFVLSPTESVLIEDAIDSVDEMGEKLIPDILNMLNYYYTGDCFKHNYVKLKLASAILICYLHIVTNSLEERKLEYLSDQKLSMH